MRKILTLKHAATNKKELQAVFFTFAPAGMTIGTIILSATKDFMN